MWQGFTGWHALVILIVILLLFGAPKLPALAKSLGQSMKILKNEVRPEKDEAAPSEAGSTASGTSSTADAPEKPKPAAGTTDSGSTS